MSNLPKHLLKEPSCVTDSTIVPGAFLFVYPENVSCFLCENWSNRLDALNLKGVEESSQVALYSVVAHTADLKFMTGSSVRQDNYLARPVMIYFREGQNRHTLDLTSFFLKDKTVEEYLLTIVEQDQLKQMKRMNTLDSVCNVEIIKTVDKVGEKSVNAFQWRNEASTLLDDIFKIDLFDSPNVFMVGLFRTSPETKLGGWSSRSFQLASDMWVNSKSNDGTNESNDHSDDAERQRQVKFVGTYNAKVSRIILQNLTDDLTTVIDEQDAVVAFKRSENVLMWMMPSDIDDPSVIVDHCLRALDLSPNPEFSRYTPETSRQIWGNSNAVHVLIVVDEAEENMINVKQQVKAIQSIVPGLPNAHFSVVPRIRENDNILSFLDILSPSSTYLKKDNTSISTGSPANVVIVDRTKKGSSPLKYRLYPDYISSTSSVHLGTKDIRSFIRHYLDNELKPHWKSEKPLFLSELPKSDEGVVAVSGLDLENLLKETKYDIILSFEAKWCRTCQMFMPRLKEAAKNIQKTFPNRLLFFSVNLENNEIDHILDDISLRQQPWQYTMPLIWIPSSSEQKSESLPWRGSHGVIPINEGEITKFILSKDGYKNKKLEGEQEGGQEEQRIEL